MLLVVSIFKPTPPLIWGGGDRSQIIGYNFWGTFIHSILLLLKPIGIISIILKCYQIFSNHFM